MKLVWVRSYKNIPRYKEKGINGLVRGYHDPATDTVYCIKGKTTKSDIAHEVYHSKKKHPDRPRSPIDFTRHELEAYLYAYRMTGNPKHIKLKLWYIMNHLNYQLYKLSVKRATDTIKLVLRSLDVPKAWKSDYRKFIAEVESVVKEARERRRGDR